jgi:hypothetical protein
MSYFPLSTLNLKCSQILVNNNSAITTVGTPIALSSISGSTNKVSLAANTITLKAGVDYFLVTCIAYRTIAATTYSDASIANTFRFGFYNTTNSSWFTQKCTNPNNVLSTGGTKNSGIREYQAYCVIPAPATDINVQFRIKTINTTSTSRLTTYRDNGDTNIGNSTIVIYHN